MDLNCLSPYIRLASDSIIHPPWHLKERVIFDYELLYIKQGRVRVTIEDRIYNGKPGEIFLFKPKQRHSILLQGDQPFHQPHLHFDLIYREDSPKVKVSFKPLNKISVEELGCFRENDLPDFPERIVLKHTQYFENLLFELICEYQDKMPYYEIGVKGLFLKLWTYLLREISLESNAGHRNINELMRIREYLQAHIYQPLSLEAIAGEFKISKYHLLRIFKKAFGITPMHYHNFLRIEHAKEKIKFTGLSLTAIAELYGFESINTFSRAFRNIDGVPPSFYRQSL